MPSWLQKQIRDGFCNKKRADLIMLNRLWFKYRKY
nr:cortex morphogenetic protein CmpA [Salsuginibacillus halophilus]